VDGTPADCVYLALFAERFLPRRPDLVLAGINHGVNLGTDVFYSGTVAGAREAAFRGIPAVAFSREAGEGMTDFTAVAEIARGMALRLLEAPVAAGHAPLLNVNFPRGRLQGALCTRLARRVYQDRVIARIDPYGREYLWLGGRPVDGEQPEGSDVDAVNRGFISVTPLGLEAVDAAHLGTAAQLAAGVEAGLAALEAGA
jgi:5'-nucleotidase